jgi:SAM-dependent methyltransferase
MIISETGSIVHSADSSGQAVYCAACASPVASTAVRQTHVGVSNHKQYSLYCCPTCELGFWWPLQADPSIYENEGFEAYQDYHSGARPFPQWAAPLFAVLPAGRGSALDIGCGDGSVLHRLADAGFEPYGIDLDHKSISIARSKFALSNVAVATLEDWAKQCAEQARRFDLITFFEVLEHQDSPLSFLAQVAQLGKPGSMVAGSVPNRSRFLAPLDRRLSDGDFPPHHFLWFSAAALGKLLARAGFCEIVIVKAGELPYRTILTKLVAAGQRATATNHGARWLLLPIMALLAPFAAAVVWLGRKLAPPHLFFRCRIPSNADRTVASEAQP